MIGWFLTHGPARRALGLFLAAVAILQFLLNLRRAGERAARPAALLIVMLWLSACAMDSSDLRAPCPPVVDYAAAEQARTVDEVYKLPEGAVIVRMLSDFAVLRD